MCGSADDPSQHDRNVNSVVAAIEQDRELGATAIARGASVPPGVCARALATRDCSFSHDWRGGLPFGGYDHRNVYSRTYEATYTGRGEFYTGLSTGDRVRVLEEVTTYVFEGVRKAKVSLSAQRLDGGAWLCLYDNVDQLASAQ